MVDGDAASPRGLPTTGLATATAAEEAFAALDANRIENVTAAVCLYWLRQHRDRLRQEWG